VLVGVRCSADLTGEGDVARLCADFGAAAGEVRGTGLRAEAVGAVVGDFRGFWLVSAEVSNATLGERGGCAVAARMLG
jgi:hypothetical protein